VESDEHDQEFLPEVAPQGDEMIFNKATAGAFNSGDLENVLRRMRIDHLVITGIVTDGCVELTARDASDRGFNVTLVSDGCSAPTPEAHEDAIARMTDGGFITAKTTDEAIALLGGMRQRAAAAA
jgi:nicotinamidase-related amidase